MHEVNELRHAARMVVRELGLLADAYNDIGITLAERHLLIELESCPNSTVGAIAERLLLDKSSASRLIARAVKKGFVAYATDLVDRRRCSLKITQHGLHTLNAFEPFAQKQVSDALTTLSADEVLTVQRGMALFAKGLKDARLRKQLKLENNL